jgi:uncharacterized protein
MKRKIAIAGALTAVILVIFFSKFSIFRNKKATVKIRNNSFQTELVSSDRKRQLGLGGRAKLCADCSMLFVFPGEGFWGFWMKNMNFNLDIIWINGNKITDMAKNVDKNSKNILYPKFKADKVLELNAEVADKKSLEIGDMVEIKY